MSGVYNFRYLKLTMDNSFWLKQTKDKPLYPDLIWSRPESKLQAGKLLIAGGNIHSFNSVNIAFQESIKAGIGSTAVLLPDVLQKTLSKFFTEAEYCISTPSGSMSSKALSALIDLSLWADGVLLAGDFGKNSETAILIETFVNKFSGFICLSNDSVDYFLIDPSQILQRDNTLLVLNYSQLTKLATAAKFSLAFTSTLELNQIVERLHDFTIDKSVNILVYKDNNIYVANKGKVSSTYLAEDNISQTKLASHASVWSIQNPGKIFEATSSSVISK